MVVGHHYAPVTAPRNVRSLLQSGVSFGAVLCGALVVLGLLCTRFGSFSAFMLRLDPVNALGPCSAGDSVKFACDFENHYYAQGVRLAVSPTAVPGYFYSGFFAVCMRTLARLPFESARAVWACVVVGSESVLLVSAALSRRGVWRGCVFRLRSGLRFVAAALA